MDSDSIDNVVNELLDIIRSDLYEMMTVDQAKKLRHALDNNHVVSFSIGIQAKDVDYLSIWEQWTDKF